MQKVLKSIFSKTSFGHNNLKYLTFNNAYTPKFKFCIDQSAQEEKKSQMQNKLDEYFVNDSCLILKARKKSKFQSFITHSLLFSVFGYSGFKLYKSLMAVKILPCIGWGFVALLTGSMNYNFYFNKSNTVESISVIRKKIDDNFYKYSLEIITMKNFNNKITFDLDSVAKIEEKKVGNYSEIFTMLVIDGKNYFMIPSKICLINNEDLYSQLMTGRIKDIGNENQMH